MKYTLAAIALSFLMFGCGQKQIDKPITLTPVETTPEVKIVETTKETPSNPEKTMTDKTTATFKTTKGDIVLELLPNEAPNITQNFIDLAKDGKYDGTIFHRVIDGFMIQGGDYENFNGTGGQAFKGGMIEDEFSSNISHVRGVISMANRGPNTNGSQFFIMHADAPHLDGRHTIFGQVIEGMDVVDAIATADADGMDKPREDITVETITIK